MHSSPSFIFTSLQAHKKDTEVPAVPAHQKRIVFLLKKTRRRGRTAGKSTLYEDL